MGLETRFRDSGYRLIAGVDEAGRGPLAGPVVAAAVILPDDGNVGDSIIIRDSKQMKPEQRKLAFNAVCATSLVAWSAVPAAQIDLINIRRATLLAMTRAVKALEQVPAIILVDGRDVPPALEGRAHAIIGGDRQSRSIAAASIIAKCVRDAIMVHADGAHPGYGFGRHSGYGTQAHMDAIARLGPCPLHRMSFAPLREATNEKGAGFEPAP